jgi:hypothetical protein
MITIKIIGLVICMIGGSLVGANSKNYWATLGVVLAQIGIILVTR